MKKGLLLVFIMLCTQVLFAQNEIGPEGHKLLWLVLLIAFIAGVFVFTAKSFKPKNKKARQPLFKNKKVEMELTKDRLYYPNALTLKIKNTSNTDLDLDRPLLVFDNFWLKRKFKLKGMSNHSFYPLFLEKGKTHTLQIDLTRFYGHDKSLKKFPKAKVILSDVNGKRLGSKAVFLRKTLLKF